MIPKKKDIKSERITLRIEPHLKSVIKEIANKHNTSISCATMKLLSMGVLKYYLTEQENNINKI